MVSAKDRIKAFSIGSCHGPYNIALHFRTAFDMLTNKASQRHKLRYSAKCFPKNDRITDYSGTPPPFKTRKPIDEVQLKGEINCK